MKEKRQTLKSKKKSNSRKLTKKSNVRNDIYIGGDQGKTKFEINTTNILFKNGSSNIIIDVSQDISSVKNIIKKNLDITGDLSINKITISNKRDKDIRSLDEIDNGKIQYIDISDISFLYITISNEDLYFNNDSSTIIIGYTPIDKSLNYLKTIVKKDLSKNVIGDVSINSIKFYKTNNSINPSNEISGGNFDNSKNFSLKQIYTDISDISSLKITILNQDISFINDTSSIVTHYTRENKKIKKLKEEVTTNLKDIEFDTSMLHDKIFFYESINKNAASEISAGSFDNSKDFSLNQIYTDISDISALTITISNDDITFNDDSSKVKVLLKLMKKKTDITNIVNKRLNQKIIGKLNDDQFNLLDSTNSKITSDFSFDNVKLEIDKNKYRILDISFVESIKIDFDNSNNARNKILIKDSRIDDIDKLKLLKDMVLENIKNSIPSYPILKKSLEDKDKDIIDFYKDRGRSNILSKLSELFKSGQRRETIFVDIRNSEVKNKFRINIEISGNLITQFTFTIKGDEISFEKIMKEVKEKNPSLDLTDVYIESTTGLKSNIYDEDNPKDDISFNAIKNYLISNHNVKKILTLKSNSEKSILTEGEIDNIVKKIDGAKNSGKDQELISFSLILLEKILS